MLAALIWMQGFTWTRKDAVSRPGTEGVQYRKMMTILPSPIVRTARRTGQTAVASIPRLSLSGIREMLSVVSLAMFALAWELPA